MKTLNYPIWLKCYMVIGILLGVFFFLMYATRQEIIEEYYQIRIFVNVVFVLWIIIDIVLKRLVSSYTTNGVRNVIFAVYVFFIIGARGLPSPFRYDWVCHIAFAFYLANYFYNVIKKKKQGN
ncbi:hypothetical protein BACCIP111895_00835 [Neobacillus rhizosphaerae]|uniref:Uncharacterized protein n=1 Tax=Neobacillus rhizosphaerae TaxID=2880965 RepID=A0ABM9EM49_9BACI|nr:hypothetical protein BACCIP111895_00835 [Neobacillus rhizosphaerae]